MPTTRAEPRHRSTVAHAALGALLLALLPACSLLGEDTGPPSTATTGGPPAPADVVQGLTRALDRRADAVRAGDRRPFLRGVAGSAPRLRREQGVYFDNLAQLPLARFSYSVDRGSIVREGDQYWAVVDLEMQLAGYDAEPVVSRDRLRFAPAPGGRGRFVLTSATDRAWEAEHAVRPQPWDLGPIEVRSGYGVLGVFDARSVASAPALVSSVERGISEVSGVVPTPWSRSVVLYALSTTEFLETIADLPGGDPERLDGVSFPVMTGPRLARPAGTRFALHPRMLERPGAERDRLVRHELTHVALADGDDEAPVWLSEGLAEYVSVRAVAPEDRVVSAAALDVALSGVDGLPRDEEFNDPATGPVVSYGLSWWVCEYIADSFGEPALWSLLEQANDPDADQARLLRDLLGLTPDQLARRAARKLVATFAPSRP